MNGRPVFEEIYHCWWIRVNTTFATCIVFHLGTVATVSHEDLEIHTATIVSNPNVRKSCSQASEGLCSKLDLSLTLTKNNTAVKFWVKKLTWSISYNNGSACWVSGWLCNEESVPDCESMPDCRLPLWRTSCDSIDAPENQRSYSSNREHEQNNTVTSSAKSL